MEFLLKPGQLTYQDIKLLLDETTTIKLDPASHAAIHASAEVVKKIIAHKKPTYGINTGFGALANVQIDHAQLETLQKHLLLSHACGTGELLTDDIVRLMLALKINALARGFSGVRLTTIELLIRLFNAKIYPCVPAKGSVGASGDLAPLAHLHLILLGVGHAHHQGKTLSAKEALALIKQSPIDLAPKEGLALINGTQASTALALSAQIKMEQILQSALITGALTVDATRSSDHPFAADIQMIRGHQGQIKAAQTLRDLLAGSAIRKSHETCKQVQDPYSIRCQPQVMGACLEQSWYTERVLMTEANAVSDNPLIFADKECVISGGNFHAEPVALCADALATAIAEIGALSERRIALLVDARFSQLPAFLVKEAGLNSGFMIAQVTAAALASENKSLAHPASVDSLPTSANQEDHVSMATYAAWRLFPMLKNTATIIAIELLAACQGIDFLRPLKSSAVLEKVHAVVRGEVDFYQEDRFFAPDIEKALALINSNKILVQ